METAPTQRTRTRTRKRGRAFRIGVIGCMLLYLFYSIVRERKTLDFLITQANDESSQTRHNNRTELNTVVNRSDEQATPNILNITRPVDQPHTVPSPGYKRTNWSTELLRTVAVQQNRSIEWDYDEWFNPDGLPKYPTTKDDKILTANYYQLMLDGHFGENAAHAVRPIRLLEKYKERHSNEALESAWRDCTTTVGSATPSPKDIEEKCPDLRGRAFVVGRYSCPLEAGNRLTKYMNHLMMAIVLDRTFLSGYFDLDGCMEEKGNSTDSNECPEELLNSRAECDVVMELAEWVPQWDDWKVRLGLSVPVRVNAMLRDPMSIPYDQPGVPRVMNIGQQLTLVTGMALSYHRPRQRLFGRLVSRVRAMKLMTGGYFFAYGMLFEALFRLQPHVFPDRRLIADTDKYHTISLHSRHPTIEDVAGDVRSESACMEKLIKINPTKAPCVVYVMSDREATLVGLDKMMPLEFGCVQIVANHAHGKSFRSEHGAFAGLGYFQDLTLVVNARDGFVAAHESKRRKKGVRTSTGLPRSVLAFRRGLEWVGRGEDFGLLTEIAACYQPFIDLDISTFASFPFIPGGV